MTAGRAVTPAVGKALEAGIVVLFVATATTALYGGVVPDARNAAGSEVGERALEHAAAEVEAAVPPSGREAAVERRVSLPESIRDYGYEIRAANGSLVLAHDHPSVGGSTPLVLPDRVRTVTGAWDGGGGVVRVEPHPAGGVVVVLADEPSEVSDR
ncbi:DUF7266 family protein [Halobacterium jilantaiense]|uniref:Uncharacterized protein n=1 Tax=Halobacterium jilantaiense TaxID=355548 RepID=A0A1I0P1J9_9EURY|nr:hypothetical protein [Halobacterium jilantaiense]SEW08049.1 hypothetical protein SAMN04487945_1325 [Halobacterium jilantaiense]